MKKGGIALVLSVALVVVPIATIQASEVLGEWVLNTTLTTELKPKPKKARGMGGFSGVAIGGIGVPLPGSQTGGPAAAAAGLKFPTVLDCKGMEITQEDEKITLSCDDGSTRDFYVGNKHGRKTVLRDKTLTERYSSTSRTVKHNFKVDSDGYLIVTVRIKAKGGQEQVHVRAFSKDTDEDSKEKQPISEERVP